MLNNGFKNHTLKYTFWPWIATGAGGGGGGMCPHSFLVPPRYPHQIMLKPNGKRKTSAPYEKVRPPVPPNLKNPSYATEFMVPVGLTCTYMYM